MPKVNDRGAKALAERIFVAQSWSYPNTPPAQASAILGTTGLFIADVTNVDPRQLVDLLRRSGFSDIAYELASVLDTREGMEADIGAPR